MKFAKAIIEAALLLFVTLIVEVAADGVVAVRFNMVDISTIVVMDIVGVAILYAISPKDDSGIGHNLVHAFLTYQSYDGHFGTIFAF